MTTVRVLAPYFPPAVDGGGPIRTLDALTRTAPEQMDIEVVTRDRDLRSAVRLDVPRSAVVSSGRRIHYLATHGVPGIIRLASAVCQRPHPDLTYVNSVFDPRFGVLPVLLHRLGRTRNGRLLIAPRGEFDPGALALKRAKKLRYLAVARATGVFRGAVWHASTELEAANIRRAVGDDVHIVVRENETTLPTTAARVPVTESDRLELVTVGRISPKKRTHLVIEALAHVTRPVRLVVIGPVDDAAYGRRCGCGGRTARARPCRVPRIPVARCRARRDRCRARDGHGHGRRELRTHDRRGARRRPTGPAARHDAVVRTGDGWWR